jgi:NAD(P)-dependent dehydrogenase (short-subunit alcohol dehydrogenase family)
MSAKKIIVTGAGSGIGLGCVRRLRENGHMVAALDIATDALEKAYANDATVVREHLDAGVVVQTLEVEPIRGLEVALDHAASTAFQISGAVLCLTRSLSSLN